jgi:hypothetical protein
MNKLPSKKQFKEVLLTRPKASGYGSRFLPVGSWPLLQKTSRRAQYIFSEIYVIKNIGFDVKTHIRKVCM